MDLPDDVYLVTTMTSSEVWQSMAVMLNSMKVFGYCFRTRSVKNEEESRNSKISVEKERRRKGVVERNRGKNAVAPLVALDNVEVSPGNESADKYKFEEKTTSRRLEVYSTVAMVAMWLNTVRILALYTGSDSYGVDLCWKLISSIWFVSGACNHSALYVAWKKLDVYDGLGVNIASWGTIYERAMAGTRDEEAELETERLKESDREKLEYLAKFSSQKIKYIKTVVRRFSFVTALYCWLWMIDYVVCDVISFFIIPRYDSTLFKLNRNFGLSGLPYTSLAALSIVLNAFMTAANYFSIAFNFLLSMVFAFEFESLSSFVSSEIEQANRQNSNSEIFKNSPTKTKLCSNNDDGVDKSEMLSWKLQVWMRSHKKIADRLRKIDGFSNLCNGVNSLTQSGVLVLLLFITVWENDSHEDLFYTLSNIAWTVSTSLSLVILSLSGVYLASKANKFVNILENLQMDDEILRAKVALFRTSYQDTGTTVFKIFILDVNAALNILGFLISFFFLNLQLVPIGSVRGNSTEAFLNVSNS